MSIKCFYSSMFIDKQIDCLEDIFKVTKPQYTSLVLDTNICIYIRELFEKGINFEEEKWQCLKELLYCTEKYDLDVNYAYGLEEACRNMESFKINEEKMNQMHQYITNIFNMDYLELVEYRKLVVKDNTIKDLTSKQDSKLKALTIDSSFKNIVVLSYALSLKVYQIYIRDKNNNVNKLNQFKEYIEFMDKQLDFVSVAGVIMGLYFFTGNIDVRDLVTGKKKPKSISDVVHNIWKGSIDLCLPVLVSRLYNDLGTIPVFVTADKGLWQIFDSMKFASIFTDNGKLLNIPQPTSIYYSHVQLDDEDLNPVINYVDNVMKARISKNINRKIDIEKEHERIKEICVGLEDSIKKIYENPKSDNASK